MKRTVCRISAVSCFALAAVVPLAWADDGMMHNGEFAEKMFKEMDANHDGKVTLDEIKSSMKKCTGRVVW